MIRRLLLVTSSLALILELAPPPAALSSGPADARITNDGTASGYHRYDGGTDAVTQACSTSRRQQNEPTVAVDPRDPNIVVAGSRESCTNALASGASGWIGYHRSTDGGATWKNSLVPGYPGDSSPAGVASPAHGCAYATDPTQAFGVDGLLHYGFICRKRSAFTLYVATYGADGLSYERTVAVTPPTFPDAPPASGEEGALNGLFTQDKPNLVVDQSAGLGRGNIYAAWVQYIEPDITLGAGLGDASFPTGINVMVVARSSDHGRTFSRPTVVAPPPEVGLPDLPDLAVGPDGAVYLAIRTLPLGCLEQIVFLIPPCANAVRTPRARGIWLARSADFGKSFSVPKLVARVHPFDAEKFGGSRDWGCGDGSAYSCENGLTFPGFFSMGAVVADETGVHVLWNGRLPNGQSKVFVRNSPDGRRWLTPAIPVDTAPAGHQFWPDVASTGGVISAVFYDSRSDPSYAPGRPPGVRADGSNPGGALDAYAAISSDGGRSWTEKRLSSASSNPNFETEDASRAAFFGDYIYVSAAAGRAFAVWTDSRDLVTGTDPREPADTDGFDGYAPCVYVPAGINAGSYTSPAPSDPCLSQGGLNLNIYGSVL